MRLTTRLRAGSIVHVNEKATKEGEAAFPYSNIEEVIAEVRAIREGHANGGYCQTEALHQVERILRPLLTAKIEAPETKASERDYYQHIYDGLSWRPRLVVATDDASPGTNSLGA